MYLRDTMCLGVDLLEVYCTNRSYRRQPSAAMLSILENCEECVYLLGIPLAPDKRWRALLGLAPVCLHSVSLLCMSRHWILFDRQSGSHSVRVCFTAVDAAIDITRQSLTKDPRTMLPADFGHLEWIRDAVLGFRELQI